jgi:RNA polymerase sigma-70 factor (ECF subfamily)
MGTSMRHATDEALIDLVKHGDDAAFETLYDRQAGRALRVARALTSDAELAAEAVQDAFLAIWRNCGRYNEASGTFQAWAMTVVRNRTIDLIRKQAARIERVPLGDELVTTLADRRAEPPEAAARLADERHVRERLGALPGSQRETLILAYYGGLSHTEIADHLALPLGTVKGRMRLALDKLRDTLPAEVLSAA